MATWSELEEQAPDVAEAARRLLSKHDVAFLATVGAGGRPRVHPFCPAFARGSLWAFVIEESPKRRDLDSNGFFAIHFMPGPEDEQFYVAGAARRVSDRDLRAAVLAAMPYDDADERHLLYEFLPERALWTTWENFQKPGMRPVHRVWRAKSKSVDSSSTGDPARHLSLEDLRKSLQASPGAPGDSGRVTLLVRRGAAGRRETPGAVVLAPDVGLPGDAWGRQKQPIADAQLAVMQREVATLIANGQPLTLFGDNLFLDLDLSAGNLPPGSRLQVGGALLEVTPKEHNGCHKFRARFGADALRFVSDPELRHRNLRGIYMRVLEAGEVRTGDPVEVLSRVR